MATSSVKILGSLTSSIVQGVEDEKNYRGFEVAPPIGQDGESDQYPFIQLGAGEMMRNHMEGREPGTNFKRVDVRVDLDTTDVKGDGFEIPLPREIVKRLEKNDLNLPALYGREQMMNAYRMNEGRIAAIAQGAGFSEINPKADYTVANDATIDLAYDILNGIESVRDQGGNPNTVVIPSAVWQRARVSPKLVAFVAGGVNPGADAARVSSLLSVLAEEGITRVVIGRGKVNTAAKGKVSLADIWNASHIWVGAGAGASPNATATNGVGSIVTPSAIATFYDRSEYNLPFFLEQYYEDAIRSEVLRVYGMTSVKLVDARNGVRIKTNYA